MSLNVKNVAVGDQEFTLRLTSKALLNFNLKHGIEGNTPTIAVLDAVSDMAAKVDLLSNALQHPEHRNKIRDGGELLDLMADDPAWDRHKVNALILDLAADAGLIHQNEAADLLDAVMENDKKRLDFLRSLLTGTPLDQEPVPNSDTKEKAENPT